MSPPYRGRHRRRCSSWRRRGGGPARRGPAPQGSGTASTASVDGDGVCEIERIESKTDRERKNRGGDKTEMMVEIMDHLMVADIRFGSSLLPYPSYRALLKSEVRAKCSFLKEIFFYNNSPTYFKTPITSKKLVTCHPLGRHAPILYSA